MQSHSFVGTTRSVRDRRRKASDAQAKGRRGEPHRRKHETARSGAPARFRCPASVHRIAGRMWQLKLEHHIALEQRIRLVDDGRIEHRNQGEGHRRERDARLDDMARSERAG
jgi:hypothetical protein